MISLEQGSGFDPDPQNPNPQSPEAKKASLPFTPRAQVADLDPFDANPRTARRRARLKEEADSLLAQAPEPTPTISKTPEAGLEGRITLTPEIIQEHQALYDWLGLQNPDGTPIDLQQEQNDNNILLPTIEQAETAEKEGYTLQLIIPGQIDRNQLITTIQAKYQQEFNSEGIFFTDQAKTDKDQTQEATTPTRPNQPYLIFLKPQLEVLDPQAHPETKDKTFPQSQQILGQHNQTHPDLNLQGLTLSEYLLLEAKTYQTNQQHIDQQNWSWLLAETVPDSQGNLARCLLASWRPGARQVHVGSGSAGPHSGDWGARFVAVPLAEGG